MFIIAANSRNKNKYENLGQLTGRTGALTLISCDTTLYSCAHTHSNLHVK